MPDPMGGTKVFVSGDRVFCMSDKLGQMRNPWAFAVGKSAENRAETTSRARNKEAFSAPSVTAGAGR